MLQQESRSKVIGLKDGRTNLGVLLCSRPPGGLGGVTQLTSVLIRKGRISPTL